MAGLCGDGVACATVVESTGDVDVDGELVAAPTGAVCAEAIPTPMTADNANVAPSIVSSRFKVLSFRMCAAPPSPLMWLREQMTRNASRV
jgi:hypothetical protein